MGTEKEYTTYERKIIKETRDKLVGETQQNIFYIEESYFGNRAIVFYTDFIPISKIKKDNNKQVGNFYIDVARIILPSERYDLSSCSVRYYAYTWLNGIVRIVGREEDSLVCYSDTLRSMHDIAVVYDEQYNMFVIINFTRCSTQDDTETLLTDVFSSADIIERDAKVRAIGKKEILIKDTDKDFYMLVDLFSVNRSSIIFGKLD